VNTILLATDGSPSAESAFELAVDLCHETGATLTVLTVRTPARHGDPDGPLADRMDMEPAVQEIARQTADAARQAGVEAVPRTAYGEPAAVIATEGELLDADLIVVGSHGRRRLGALGSVSRALLHRSRVPVTVVRSAERAPTPA
jgi:nucleotide-binding universal stress UspA family protein